MGYSPFKNGLSISDIQKKYNVTKRVAEDARRCILKTSLPSRGLPGSKAHYIASLIQRENCSVNTKQLKVNRYISITDEFLYFIGWYLAEGSHGANTRIELDFHINEIQFAQQMKSFLENYFSIEPVVEQNGKNKCRLRACGKVLSVLLGNLCGIHALNKKVSSIFIRSPKKLGYLIKGLFQGDGCIQEEGRSISLSTISPSLAYQVRYICAANNILVSINEQKPRDTGKYPFFICTIATPCLDKWMSFTKSTHHIKKINRKAACHFKETDDFFFVQVKKIEYIKDYNKEVYDICVEDSHSFVANGILAHNTQVEAMAAGTPVVAPRNTSVPQILGENSERGYIYECNDEIWIDNSGFRPKGLIPDIVEQMMNIYKDGDKFSNPKVQAAREWAIQHDWNKVTKDWVKLFNEIAAENKRIITRPASSKDLLVQEL
jgi:hypothetical protein